MAGKVDKLMGGTFREKDEGTGTGAEATTLTSVDGSITLVQDGTNYDVSVNKAALELFASNESELLNAWTIGRASGKSFKVYITGTITFTANRDFICERGEPEVSFVGYPRNVFNFGSYRVNTSRLFIDNIDFRTTTSTYIWVKEGYITLRNARFVDDVLYNSNINNMKIHVHCYSNANNNTGGVVVENLTHYTQNVTWNTSGDIQPFIISNDGTLYHNLYVNIKGVDSVQSFDRFSRVLIKASVSTPYKVTGDPTWYFHPSQEMPGTGNIEGTSEILKQSSFDLIRADYVPEDDTIVKLLGLDASSKVRYIYAADLKKTDPVIHSDLLSSKDLGELIPGMLYEITDFKTKHRIPNTSTIHEGSTESLIVMATSSTTIGNRAWSLDFPKDYIEYDITDVLCEDGTTARKGKITFRRDEKNNETHYDFRNVIFRRWKLDISGFTAWTSGQDWVVGDKVTSGGNLYHCIEAVTNNTINPYNSAQGEGDKNFAIITDGSKYLHYASTDAEYPNFDEFDQILYIPVATGTGAYKDFYTFSDIDGNEKSSWGEDLKIGSGNDDLNNIVFILATSGSSSANTIKPSCFNITLYGRNKSNEIDSFTRNLFLDDTVSNCKIGSSSSFVYIYEDSSRIQIDPGGTSIIIGKACSSIKIDASSGFIMIADVSARIDIGIGGSAIKIGKSNDINIGSGAFTLSIGHDCHSITYYGENSNIIIGSGASRIKFSFGISNLDFITAESEVIYGAYSKTILTGSDLNQYLQYYTGTAFSIIDPLT